MDDCAPPDCLRKKISPSPEEEEATPQFHRRITDEQVKVLLWGYCRGKMIRADLQDMLGIRKTHFFALLNAYRYDPEAFSIVYRISTQGRLSADVEAKI